VLWYVAPVREAFFLSVFRITGVLGIDPGLIISGSAHMRFG